MVAIMAASAALAAGDLRFCGKVAKPPDSAGIFEARAKDAIWKVALGDSTAIERHKATPLALCKSGAKIAVLGKRVKAIETADPSKSTPDNISRIAAIVVGEGFEPPPVPPELSAKGIEWISGTLQRAGTKTHMIGNFFLMAGPDRRAIEIEPADRGAIAKGATVLVEGEGEERAKEARARRVAVLAPEIEAAEYRLAFGL
jgi:hypothetical protein